MKTASTIICLAALVASASATATAPLRSAFRQLQWIPQTNDEATEFMPEATQQPATDGITGEAVDSSTGNGLTTAGTGTEADAATDGAAAADPTSGSTTTALMPQAATTLTIAPGQPTIMVLLPDFLVASSSGSGFKDEITEAPASLLKPVPTTSTPTSSAMTGAVPIAMTIVLAVVTVAF
jgi:hypothetical protein